MIEKKLVIVESPAKAKTIGRYLGSAYTVQSCVGHIRDLPGKNTQSAKVTKKRMTQAMADTAGFPSLAMAKLVEKMGIDPYHGWKACYEIPPEKIKVCGQLRHAAQRSSCVYLATDLDREGEAIAWHLQEVLGGCNRQYHRIRFNEITPQALQKAIEAPSEIAMDRVRAQQTRRFLDRLVGYMLSPVLWEKVARGLSAGRVQSPAVRLIVEKERTIKAFEPQPYWELVGIIQASADPEEQLTLRVTQYAGKTLKLETQENADVYFKKLRESVPVLKNYIGKNSRISAPPPFITSTLQQTASRKLKFSVKQTMRLAQLLYENGWITYMRTDSVHIGQEALALIRAYIVDHFSKDYLPEQPIQHASHASSQEAHEAIRPTKTLNQLTESDQKRLGEDAHRLYQLIFNQFLASQMQAAEIETIQLQVTAGEFLLSAKGKRVLFDGWTKILGLQFEDNQWIPERFAHHEMPIEWNRVELSEHVTRAPNRYSEAALVRELEKRGIGRPSTYASILETIQDRGYATTKKRRFFANKLGEVCTQLLHANFEDLMSYDFTARMEKKLDEIARGRLEWSKVLSEFFDDFNACIAQAKLTEMEGGMPKVQALPVHWNCVKCGLPMNFCLSKAGPFLGCSGYQQSRSVACKQTLNLIDLSQLYQEAELTVPRTRCPVCQSVLEDYWIANTKESVFQVCSGYPCDCQYTQVREGGLQVPIQSEKEILSGTMHWPCNLCTGSLILKPGRFGNFAACDTCGQTRKLTRSGQLAPPLEKPIDLPELPCDKHPETHYVLREGLSGIFLAARNFPAVRETRAPSVQELKRFQDRLPEKWHYLLTAPLQTSSGALTFVRFDRKLKTHYIGAKQNNQWTRFVCRYEEGAWVELPTKS